MAEQKEAKQADAKKTEAKQPANEIKKEIIKKGDFIEIDYIGALKSDGKIFDTTDEGVAKKEGFYSKGTKYGPAVICVGESNIVKGIDRQLEGKETGTEYVLDIKPEEGFGKKDAKLIQLISTSKFLKQKINPVPGLQLNIDGMMGTIKNVSGGRTLVDFNHPLSGQDIVYKIRVNRIVKDDKIKLRAMLNLGLGLPEDSIEIAEITDGKAVVKTKQKLDLPKELLDALTKKANSMISGVKELEFRA